MQTDRLVIANSRSRYAWLLLICSAFAAVGALIALRVPGLLAYLIGGASLVFFGGGAVLFAFQLIDRRPRLILDGEGLYDRALGITIPWRDIVNGELHSVRGHAFVTLRLRDPACWLDQLSPRRQRLAGLTERFGFAVLNVNLSGAAVDPQVVLKRILRYSAMHEPGRG